MAKAKEKDYSGYIDSATFAEQLAEIKTALSGLQSQMGGNTSGDTYGKGNDQTSSGGGWASQLMDVMKPLEGYDPSIWGSAPSFPAGPVNSADSYGSGNNQTGTALAGKSAMESMQRDEPGNGGGPDGTGDPDSDPGETGETGETDNDANNDGFDDATGQPTGGPDADADGDGVPNSEDDTPNGNEGGTPEPNTFSVFGSPITAKDIAADLAAEIAKGAVSLGGIVVDGIGVTAIGMAVTTLLGPAAGALATALAAKAAYEGYGLSEVVSGLVSAFPDMSFDLGTIKDTAKATDEVYANDPKQLEADTANLTKTVESTWGDRPNDDQETNASVTPGATLDENGNTVITNEDGTTTTITENEDGTTTITDTGDRDYSELGGTYDEESGLWTFQDVESIELFNAVLGANTSMDEYDLYTNYILPYYQDVTTAKHELLPGQQEYEQTALDVSTNAVSDAGLLAKAQKDAALQGVNAEEWANSAGQEVVLANADAEDTVKRAAANMGMDVNSTKFLTALDQNKTDLSANVAFAKSDAIRAADTESFNRLGTALSGSESLPTTMGATGLFDNNSTTGTALSGTGATAANALDSNNQAADNNDDEGNSVMDNILYGTAGYVGSSIFS